MANEQNLVPFKKGYDIRRGRKPKGSKHISTYIREALEGHKMEYQINGGDWKVGYPIQAMVEVLAVKAVKGDLRAFDLLAKHGYRNMVELTHEERTTLTFTPEQAEQLLRLRAARRNRDDIS